MYDIKPLEEEWEKYNKKRKRPRYIFILIAFLSLGVAILWKYGKSPLLNADKNSSTRKMQTSDVLADKTISTLEVHKTKVKDNNIRDNNPMDPSDVFVDRDEKKVQTVKSVFRPDSDEQTRTRKKIHFEMVDANTPRAYKEIESRFAFAPDPDDALFLARIYYKKGNYRKAAYWALQTNKLNGGIEESWLIFAKAKARTGQKNEAIQILTQYVKKSNSVEARKLLKKLKK